jgi:basic amino acid/polyamine antiporter, APA family
VIVMAGVVNPPPPVSESSGGPAEAVPAAGPAERSIGLTSATGLVIGSVIGIGVFTMPAVLASAGTSSLIVLGVVAVGAMLLAVLFGQLTRRVPNSSGGLYAYARYEFGDFAGFVTGWSYWISSWAGDAAIVASWVFYVDALFAIRPAWWGTGALPCSACGFPPS